MSELYRETTGFTQIDNSVIDGLETPLSHPAYRLYIYLCKCAGQKGEAYPGYRKICENCRIGSRTTVKKALDELVSYGLIRVRNRKRKLKNGNVHQRSNMYILKNKPHEHLLKYEEEFDDDFDDESEENNTPASSVNTGLNGISGTPTVPGWSSRCTGVVQSLDRGGPVSVPVKNNHLKTLNEKGGGIAAENPPKKKHGDKFQMVELTDAERVALVSTYGEELAANYITRMDMYLASKGNKIYRNHYAAIVSWIMRDKINPPKNRFNNFASSRSYDAKEIERLEREYQLKRLEEE